MIQQHAGLQDRANEARRYEKRTKNTFNIFTQIGPFYLNQKSADDVKMFGNYDAFYFAQKLYLDDNVERAKSYLQQYLKSTPLIVRITAHF